jgi:hypothetical protein
MSSSGFLGGARFGFGGGIGANLGAACGSTVAVFKISSSVTTREQINYYLINRINHMNVESGIVSYLYYRNHQIRSLMFVLWLNPCY